MSSTQNTRYMATNATAQTWYPTGVQMGVVDAAATTLNGHALSRTATAGSSWYASNGRSPTDMRYGAIIKRLSILIAGSVGDSFVAIQPHGGTPAISPSIPGDALANHDFGDGIPIAGGFRVVTTGATAPTVAIIYDVIER